MNDDLRDTERAVEAHRRVALTWRERADVTMLYLGLYPDAKAAYRFMKDREAAHNKSARKLLWEAIDERACKMES